MKMMIKSMRYPFGFLCLFDKIDYDELKLTDVFL